MITSEISDSDCSPEAAEQSKKIDAQAMKTRILITFGRDDDACEIAARNRRQRNQEFECLITGVTCHQDEEGDIGHWNWTHLYPQRVRVQGPKVPTIGDGRSASLLYTPAHTSFHDMFTPETLVNPGSNSPAAACPGNPKPYDSKCGSNFTRLREGLQMTAPRSRMS